MNLSITFRNINAKTRDKITGNDMLRIMNKYGIKSSGYTDGQFDVNDEITYLNRDSERDYILQYNDCSCRLICYLNAYIYWFKKLPKRLEYKSESYLKVLSQCGGHDKDSTHYGRVITVDPALKILKKIEAAPCKKQRIHTLKREIIKQLGRGNLIDFAIFRPSGDFHCCLLVKYFKETDSFKVINGGIFTDETPVEYISWSNLTPQKREKHKIWNVLRTINFISTCKSNT